jgi:hypothetical protein
MTRRHHSTFGAVDEVKKANLLRALELARLHDIAPAIAFEIISAYDRGIAGVEFEDLGASWSRTEEIDRLYEELGNLRLKAAQPSVAQEEVREKLSRLRKLQAEETAEMRQRLRERMPFEPGSGRAALEKAKRLLLR